MKENNLYGRTANILFAPLTEMIEKLFPKFHKRLSNNIAHAGLEILTTTYISALILTSFIIIMIFLSLSVILLYKYTLIYPLILTSLLVILTIMIFLTYPKLKSLQRKKVLDEEMPFIITFMAMLVNEGAVKLDLFKPLLHYKEIKIEALRIINFVHYKNLGIEQAILETSRLTPSKKLQSFLEELSGRINSPLSFLNQKSSEYNLNYKKKVKYYLFKESSEILHTLHFKIKYILFIAIAVILLTLNFYFLFDFMGSTPFYSYALLFLAVIIGFVPIFVDINSIFKTQREQEHQFLHFLQDLKANKLVQLKNKDYGILTVHTQKLVNQYSMGIPMTTIFHTLAKETKNDTINQIVKIAGQMHHKNFVDNLELAAKVFIQKNRMKFEK